MKPNMNLMAFAIAAACIYQVVAYPAELSEDAIVPETSYDTSTVDLTFGALPLPRTPLPRTAFISRPTRTRTKML